MKTLSTSIAIFLAGLLSANAACEAVFTYTIVGNTVTFYGTSNVSQVTYTWQFGDQTVGTGQTVTHTYAQFPEHYQVCLTITEPNQGCSDEVCETIYIQSGPPSCEASFDYIVNEYNQLHFFGEPNEQGVEYEWHFGDGSTSTGNSDPWHTYPAQEDHYTVCLYIHDTNTGCRDTICELVYIEEPTPCEATIDYVIENGNQVHFFGNPVDPNMNYEWHFGDGTTDSGNSDPWHTYQEYPEHYEVCLIISNNSGCHDTICETIYIQSGPECNALFTYLVEDNIVTFVGSPNSSGILYHWDFGDGEDGNGEHITHTYLEYPEHYDVCLIINNTNTGCIDTVCQNIYIPNGPQECEASMDYVIEGNEVHFFGSSNIPNVDYHWIFGDGETLSGNDDPWHTYDEYPEHYTVCLVITNTNENCQDTVCETVYVENGPSNCEAVFTYTISGNEIALHGTSNIPGVTYQWVFGDGSSGTGQDIEHTYSVYPEHYNVCLIITSPNGCSDEVCENIYIQSGPQECVGTFSYTINDNVVSFHGESNVNGVDYYWLFGDGEDGNGQNITHTYSEYPEHYQVCMVIHNTNTNCLDTVCETIYVQNGPNQACEASFTYEINDNMVSFHGSANVNNVDYKWLFGDGSTQIGQNATHTYAEYPEHYQVCLVIWNTSINCRDTICETIYVQSGPPQNCEGVFTYYIQGNDVHFVGTSNVPGVTYSWSFGDGETVSGDNDPLHTYNVYPEHYDVCMYISNNNGCADTVCQSIYIQNGGNGGDCEAAFTYVIDQNEVHFYGTSTENNVDYHWLFGDGEDGNGQSPTHTYSEYPEHYTVCLVVHNNNLNCLDTVCQTVYIQGGGSGNNCQATFSYEIDGNEVTFHGTSTESNVDYYWLLGDGHDAVGQNVTHSYSEFPEHYDVCLIVRNTSLGCIDTICQNIYIQSGQACSSEFTYTITGNEVHFHGPSNSSGTTYQWSFGDGGSSDNHNPNHHYSQAPEHYDVCLTVTGPNNCSSTTCHNIYIQGYNTQQYELSGTIYAGQNHADIGTVYLIHFNPNIGSLQAVSSTQIGSNGHYSLNVSAGNYFVKAALSANSAYYEHRLPTYYIHDLFWNSADVISLNGNLGGIDIHLIEGINPGGPGFIGGLVTEGANKNVGPGDPVEGAQVMLLTMQDEPVQYAYTNTSGEFAFSNLAYGTYKVYGEVINHATVPAIITINANSQTVDNVNLIVTDKEVTTGVFEQSVLNNAGVSELFPNPTNSNTVLNISLTEGVDLDLKVFDISGRQVYNTTLNLSNGNNLVDIPTSTLVSGVYTITLVEEKANSVVHRKLVKLN